MFRPDCSEPALASLVLSHFLRRTGFHFGGKCSSTRAAMLTISDLTYRIAGRTLLEGASAQINSGWKVGLVGRNGAGKSTLLDLIRGERQSDGGDIQLQNDVLRG